MKTATSLRIGLALGALLAGLCLMAGPAQAYEGINLFSMTPTGTQAGGHPDISIKLEWDNSRFKDGNSAPPSTSCACDDPRILFNHLPTGFTGNPHAAPVCEIVEFSFGRCPPSSQVGLAYPFGALIPLYVPFYNLAPHPDEASLAAFWAPLVAAPVFIRIAGRTDSDYGLDAESAPIYHVLPFPGAGIDLWGVPADPVHDVARFIPPLKGFAACQNFEECPGETNIAANVPPVPYLEAPTQCGVPLTGSVDIEYYTHNVYHADQQFPSTTGCEQLTFNPSLSAVPTTNQTDSAAGVDIDLKVPQEQSATTPSPSEIRSTTVTMPQGFSINPNAADGKTSCADADTGIGTLHGTTCPEFSKVGTLTLDSSALPTPIPGAIYLGEPKPGERYRLIVGADGYGTHIKIAGTVHLDQATGQLVVSFNELPQAPLTEFNLHFFGSERGLLATPTQCGTYQVESEFVPWDGALPPQHSLSSFTISAGSGGGPCPGKPLPFSPTLRAGTVNATAGVHSPFSLAINRADGDQNLNTLTVKAPPGFAATLKGIPYCPDAALTEVADSSYSGVSELALPKCPPASQIGTALAGAGAGTRPVHLPGVVYLAGPYRGAPLSLAVVTPAVSGPYDLGNAVVRAAVFVDPVTARVTTVSDPLPQILGGVPLRLRSIVIDLNRPDFTLNPTNCDPFAVETSIGGTEGGVAKPTAGFQVANCASLPYAPKLSLRLTGGVKRRGHPAVHAIFRAGSGEANTGSVSVALPKGELLDNAHIDTICTRPSFATGACPAGSLIGTAEATTPLLDNPLRGNVYLRANPEHELPDLVMDLRGQIKVELAGTIDTVKGGALRTTFDAVPDAPISQFTLDLVGGSKGLLQNSESLCGKPKKANTTMTGQNGAVLETKTKLQASCGSKARHKRHHTRKAGH